MHTMLPSEWIYRFVAHVRERDPSLPPKDAVSLARAAAEKTNWRERLPEEVATMAWSESELPSGHFPQTEPAVFDAGRH